MWISSPHLRLSSQWWWSLFQEIISGERDIWLSSVDSLKNGPSPLQWLREMILLMAARDGGLKTTYPSLIIKSNYPSPRISETAACQRWQFENHISIVRDDSFTSRYPSISTEWSLKNGRWLHVFHLFPRNDYGINEEWSLSDMTTWVPAEGPKFYEKHV